MAAMRWDPFTALSRLDDEFDGMMRRTFGNAPMHFVPPVEMVTDGTDVLITLEIPGVDLEDVDLEVHEGRLTITGERKDRWDGGRDKLLVRELRYGSFRRTFKLPDGVTAEQIDAEADRGLLRVRVRNVTKPVTPPQKIAVRTGAQQPSLSESA